MTTIRLYDVRATYELVSNMEHGMTTVLSALTSRSAAWDGVVQSHTKQEPPRGMALDGVDLEIRNGETMGILGPSGCGKSTLLRAIAGLMPLQSGVITYDDRDMRDVPPGERGIGIVFQNYALYPTMTSFDNVGFFFRIHKREAEIPERVREVSRVMGIGFDKLLDRQPGKLSGGERQRVAVARCIARDPKLFLFDEPLSNLDAKLRVQTRTELKRLIGRYKITGVYVTHDQTEALALCDRIAIMEAGKIEQVGTAQFLLEHPNSVSIATFFGHPPMNTFEGVVVEGYFQCDQFTLPLPGYDHGEGRRITLGVRAEHLYLDPDGPIRAEVVLVEPVPVQRAVFAYMEMPKAKVVALLPLHLHVGDRLNLSIDVSHCHLFDTRTGRRL